MLFAVFFSLTIKDFTLERSAFQLIPNDINDEVGSYLSRFIVDPPNKIVIQINKVIHETVVVDLSIDS